MEHLSLSFFNLIVELGDLQGIIMAVWLTSLPQKSGSKTLLSLVLLTLALLSFKILLHTLGLWNLPVFHRFPLAIDTTLPPLIYLYACSVTGLEVSGKRMLFYFAPTIIFMLYALIVYGGSKTEPFYFNTVKSGEDLVAVISGILYWFLGYRRIVRYRRWVFGTQSDSRLAELTWLKNLLVISGIMVVLFVMAVLWANHFMQLELFYGYLAGVTYYLSLKGYSLYASPALIQMPTDLSVETSTKDETAYPLIKEAISRSLENDRIYLDPELSLKQMAAHTGYPAATVSAVINQSFGMNFRNLINRYRVAEVKRRLKDPPAHLSLYGIALECGFNSEASFYRVFRQETGQSPNDYIQNIINAQNRF